MNLRAPKISGPFSSRTEEEKEELSQRLNLYKDKLDDQWSDIKSDLAEHGKRAAVIGGIVLGVFGLLNLVLPKADDESDGSEQEPVAGSLQQGSGIQSRLGIPLAGAVQSLLWTVAMSWAKERVKEFVVADKSANIESEG